MQADGSWQDVKFGPDCSGSYFKSAPDWKPGTATYHACCDTSQKFICATYTDAASPSSTYASCMTVEACRTSNGGQPWDAKYDTPQGSKGWHCKPNNPAQPSNPFPQCQNYYAMSA